MLQSLNIEKLVSPVREASNHWKKLPSVWKKWVGGGGESCLNPNFFTNFLVVVCVWKQKVVFPMILP